MDQGLKPLPTGTPRDWRAVRGMLANVPNGFQRSRLFTLKKGELGAAIAFLAMAHQASNG